jgi:HK97 family phage portal protein
MTMKLPKLFQRKAPPKMPDFIKGFPHPSAIITGRDSTTFACLNLIASTFANLSGGFYAAETREKIPNYPLSRLLRNPNLDDTHFAFFYNCAVDFFNGNVYLFKALEDGEIVSLFRLNPFQVKVTRDPYNRKVFRCNQREYTAEQIMHIPSLYSFDGLIGKSIFNECATIFSTILEIEQFTQNSFNNAIGKRLVIDITKAYPDATDEQIEQLKATFFRHYSGVENSGKPLIKSNKIDYTTVDSGATENRGQQLAENRELTAREISKLFGAPYELLTGHITGNIEAVYIAFIENAIRPLATLFEESINKFLIPDYDKDRVYFEYNYSGLLKTNLAARIDSYTKQMNAGVLSVNEIRHRENLHPIPAGDTHFFPANLAPLTPSVVDSYMAGAKLKQQELDNDHPNIGDDKAG